MAESYFRQRVRRSGGLVLWEDIGIAAGTVALALLSLDRQTAREKVIDAIAFGLGAAVLWQVVRWAARFLFTVPREMHNELLAERDRALAQVAQLEARKPVTRAEWMEMSSEFRAVQDLAIRVTWYQSEGRELWSFFASITVAADHASALCKRAGAMLLASPRVAAALPASVRNESDAGARWLRFIRVHPQTCVLPPHVGVDSGGVPIPAESGSFENLPVVSARVCVECSAVEI